MAHYAKVVDGKVVKVIVADTEFFNTFVDDSPGEWIETDYNTYGDQHRLGGVAPVSYTHLTLPTNREV